MFNKMGLIFSKYKGSKEILCEEREIAENIKAIGGHWQVATKAKDNGFKIKITLEKGEVNDFSVGLKFCEKAWAKEDYLLIPAAVYGGNRFKVSHKKYPPILYKGEDIGVDMDTVITDVPRLNLQGGGKIDLLSGDMATPAVCVYSKEKNEGFILLFSYKTNLGYNGVKVEEKGKEQSIKITAPGVREKMYTMCSANSTSVDKGASIKAGGSLSLEFKSYSFSCSSIEQLYEKLFDLRYKLAQDTNLAYELPYSKEWQLSEQKYNKENYNEQGYYRVGTDDNLYQDFQSGWVGGGINIYPLYLLGGEKSKERAKSTFSFIFDKLQVETGFFYGVYYKGKAYGDCFSNATDTSWLLLRKNADMLIFLIKTWALINREDKVFGEKYKSGLVKAADAFVKLWQENNQWGQYVDIKSGKITLGGTASAGAGVAALVLAFKYFGKEEYLHVAKKAGNYYYSNFTKKGLTNGGPGEILQTPDSESAFALLESFVTLYEYTCENKWLVAAQAAANQAASWCVSYNFEFPKGSEFNRLNIKTIGSVYANCQNKHSAPGICTFSGDSLLKLYRFTKNKGYLRLIMEIAHNITQYTSREDRPIYALNGRATPSGYMNERVNMCDWEGQEMVGNIFYGSCWCECSAMLTVAQLPSIYILGNTLCCFDNIRASLKGSLLEIENPTGFDSMVSVLVDGGKSMEEELLGARKYFVKQGEKITVEL